jgi:hypothetical protein
LPRARPGRPDRPGLRPDGPQTDGGTGDDASSTDAPEPCSRVHEGDLKVDDDTDLASLGDLGRVTGALTISMQKREQRELSFLGCLHTLDSLLFINDNGLLESTEGLENLKSIKSLWITGNPNLRVVTGFDQIRELERFRFRSNPAVEEIQLDSIETANWIEIGYCQGSGGFGQNLDLVDLSGFSGLTTVYGLSIDGNEALISADLLDALAANGAPAPLGEAHFRFNPLLSEATILARLDALDVQYREVCGNAGGDPDDWNCNCADSE